jgi:hypothetical protein
VEASVEEAHNERRTWTKKKDLGTLVLKVDGVSGFKRSREQVEAAARNYAIKLKKQRGD